MTSATSKLPPVTVQKTEFVHVEEHQKTSASGKQPTAPVGGTFNCFTRRHNNNVARVANWSCCRFVEKLRVEQNSTLFGKILKITAFILPNIALMMYDVVKGAFTITKETVVKLVCCGKKSPAPKSSKEASSQTKSQTKSKTTSDSTSTQTKAKLSEENRPVADVHQEPLEAEYATHEELHPLMDGIERIDQNQKRIDQNQKWVINKVREIEGSQRQLFHLFETKVQGQGRPHDPVVRSEVADQSKKASQGSYSHQQDRPFSGPHNERKPIDLGEYSYMEESPRSRHPFQQEPVRQEIAGRPVVTEVFTSSSYPPVSHDNRLGHPSGEKLIGVIPFPHPHINPGSSSHTTAPTVTTGLASLASPSSNYGPGFLDSSYRPQPFSSLNQPSHEEQRVVREESKRPPEEQPQKEAAPTVREMQLAHVARQLTGLAGQLQNLAEPSAEEAEQEFCGKDLLSYKPLTPEDLENFAVPGNLSQAQPHPEASRANL